MSQKTKTPNPATKGVKVEEESDVLALDVLRAGPETSKGDVKNEEETLVSVTILIYRC